ncbi:MAG TPA: alpha/beta hydrolase [Lacipirellulaceae bacterium]|nr:alpha/beta hydrolase [Lacipirellulaceae bacterium]
MRSRSTRLLFAAILLVFSSIAKGDDPQLDVLYSRTYVTRDTGPLEADVYMPPGKGPFPAMLVVHGGAWRVGTRAQLAGISTQFAQHGYTAVSISYRLAPQSKFPAQLYDCQAAVRWMRKNAAEFKIDPERIGGFGYSAGGHLVALLGTLDDKSPKEPGVPADAPSARLQCVLAGGAPCDFRGIPADSTQLAYWLGGSRAEKADVYRDASPAAHISSHDPPMYFFSGEDDIIVPIGGPRQMVESLKAAGVTAEMHSIKNAGHLQALFDEAASDHAFAFADRYLKNTQPQRVASGRTSAPPPSANSSTTAPANEGADGQ